MPDNFCSGSASTGTDQSLTRLLVEWLRAGELLMPFLLAAGSFQQNFCPDLCHIPARLGEQSSPEALRPLVRLDWQRSDIAVGRRRTETCSTVRMGGSKTAC